MLLWAECYAANSIDELDGRCGSGSASSGSYARTTFGSVDDYTNLYWRFFYGENIAERAATLFHEARHAGAWCHHSSDSSCPRGTSCDPSYENGCQGFGSGSGKGANGVQVDYFSWYVASALSYRTTSALKTRARDKANDILTRGFQKDPCLIMRSNGSLMSCTGTVQQ